MRQDTQDDGPCFSATPPDAAAIPGPDQITFALDASRTGGSGLALTLGVIGLSASAHETTRLANTVTIVFRAGRRRAP